MEEEVIFPGQPHLPPPQPQQSHECTCSDWDEMYNVQWTYMYNLVLRCTSKEHLATCAEKWAPCMHTHSNVEFFWVYSWHINISCEKRHFMI